TEGRVPIETVQSSLPLAMESMSMNREVHPQSSMNRPESRDIFISESLNDVGPVSRHEPSTVASQPDRVQGQAERATEPALTATNSLSAENVGSDPSETARHASPTEAGENVVSTTPGSSLSPQAALTTASNGQSRASDRSAGLASASTRGSSPDYSWLRRLLWERIDRIKQYSDDALEHEWEGRVVMVVTIQ